MSALAEIRDMVASGLREARHGQRDLRLQAREARELATSRGDGPPLRWFVSFSNGWVCCPDGHKTPEEAARCLETRLGG